MQTLTAEILVKGKPTRVAAVDLNGVKIVCNGSWLRVAQIFDEPWLEQPTFECPEHWIAAIRQSPLQADIVTFSQALPDTSVRYPFHVDHESLAVAPTARFEDWWQGLPHESRKNVRKCQKRGVRVEGVEFSDALVRGIKGIYDETPVRQGRRFWHYGKSFETVRQQNSSYLDRSQFIGAYLGDELIGFLKMVYVGRSARIMQILSRNAHYDKHPMNALLATAVELCSKHGIEHLIYGQYVYGNKHGSSVTEFKRRNGFTELLLPHYYVPFTLRGRIAVAARLYRSLGELLPEPMINAALKARDVGYKYFARSDGARS